MLTYPKDHPQVCSVFLLQNTGKELQKGLERWEGNNKGTRELNVQKKYKNEGKNTGSS